MSFRPSPPLSHHDSRPMSISTISMPPSYPNESLYPQHTPLTKLLFGHAPGAFRLATQHPFLQRAGRGTLPASTLSKWLSQDRIYAQAYVNFIGSLIGRIHLPHQHVADKSASLRWRILALLTSCLTNINRELDFFDETARKYNLQLDRGSKDGAAFEPLATTKQYEALFRAFGSDPSMTLLEGLVVLWATEICYLHAWKYARSFWPEERSTNPDRATPMPGVLSSPQQGQQAPDHHNRHSRQEQPHSPNMEPSTPQSAATVRTTTSSHYSSNPSHAGPLTPTSERAIYDAPELVIEPRRDLDGGALRESFIPNWTSREFEKFVEDIGDVMDELSVREEGWRRIEVFKAVWEHVLGIEQGFWPAV